MRPRRRNAWSIIFVRLLCTTPAWTGTAFAQAASDEPTEEAADASDPQSQEERERASVEEPREVVVRGERRLLRHSSRTPTAASTVVEGEELQAAGATSSDVLSRVPGVQVARRGAQSELSTASIRGSDSKQVPVYVAGIRINDDVSGTADLSTVPLWMMDRIEVFRGNAPERADRLGMGGAVFFTPRLPRESRVGAGARLGSWGQREGWVSGEVAGSRAASLVALRRGHADNDYPFTNDQGRRFDLDEREEQRQNADFTEHEAWAIGRYRLGPGAHVTSVMQGFEREQGVTGLSVVPARRARGRTRRLLMGVSSRLPCRPGSEVCALKLNSSLVTASLTLRDPAFELPALRSPVLHNHGERFTQYGGIELWPQREWKVSASVVQAFENVRIDRNARVSPRGNRSSTRLAAQTQWQPTRRWLFHALAALECHRTKGIAERFGQPVFERSDTCGVLEPVGRIGTKLELARDLQVLGNVGRYVRVPTLAELYGTSSSVSGNPELQAERGWSADLGTRAEWQPDDTDLALALDAFAFARWADDLVRFRRSSMNTVTPFNVASARFLGAEIAAAADAWSMVKAKVATTLLDPRETTADPSLDPTANDLLPFTSQLVMTSSLELYTKPGFSWLAQDRASLTFRYHYRSARFQDSAGQTILPDQHFVDVELSSSFLEGTLLTRLATRNLLDQRTSDLLGLPLPGRTYHASVEVWF